MKNTLCCCCWREGVCQPLDRDGSRCRPTFRGGIFYLTFNPCVQMWSEKRAWNTSQWRTWWQKSHQKAEVLYRRWLMDRWMLTSRDVCVSRTSDETHKLEKHMFTAGKQSRKMKMSPHFPRMSVTKTKSTQVCVHSLTSGSSSSSSPPQHSFQTVWRKSSCRESELF